MTVLSPLPTFYSDCWFKSRLEARWAVFFDALNIGWEYEAEGYDTGPLGWYLPDFWLPDYDLYIEVKPQNHLTDEEFAITVVKVNQLRNGDQNALLICGSPGKDNYVVADYFDSDTEEIFALDPVCDCLVLVGQATPQTQLRRNPCGMPECCSESATHPHYGLDHSYAQARSYMFSAGPSSSRPVR